MTGPADPQPPSGPDAIPALIERYRLRRDAWIAQADELARLRDEVRGSAEREAMEIVTNARRDVRRIVMEARRELLVLSAQVQAALGEVSKADPAALLRKAGIAPSHADGSPALGEPAETFIPESAVAGILDEVQADMEALAEDARALPLSAVAPTPPGDAERQGPPEPQLPAAPTDALASATSPHAGAALSEAASRALLSRPFPSEAVPVAPGRSIRTFVAAFVAVGLAVVLLTVWWLRSDSPQSIVETAEPVDAAELEAVEIAAAPAEPTLRPEPAGVPTTSTGTTSGRNLTVVAEAIGEVWVRTTVDGQSDLGRTLQAGQRLEVSADESISLRVGDAGALIVSVNNGEKRPLGRAGQVMTRQFFAEQPANVPAPRGPLTVPPSPAASPPTVTAEPVAPSPSPTPPPRVAVADLPPSPPPAGATTPPPQPVGLSPARAGVPPPPSAPARAPVADEGGADAAASSPAAAVVAAARQWLDAYHRQDRAMMAALSTDNMQLTDERRSDERLPPGSSVTRTLDRVSVQVAADTAVLTAVMTEQSPDAPSPQVSPVSQVWILGTGGQWRVRQARFVSEARLNQVFR